MSYLSSMFLRCTKLHLNYSKPQNIGKDTCRKTLIKSSNNKAQNSEDHLGRRGLINMDCKQQNLENVAY